MSKTQDNSGQEFSVRDQFAGRDGALKGSPAPAGAPPPAASGSREPGPAQPPLRRPLTAETMLQQIDWVRLARGVMRRAWLIALLAVVGGSLGLLLAVRAGRVKYEARASLLYRTERQKQTIAASGSAFAINGLARSTALSLLRRTSNMEAIQANLKLTLSAEELRWRIQTKSEKNSEIVLLTVDGMPSAEMALKVVNEAARVALADNREFYRAQAVHGAEQFQQQANLTRKELDALTEQLTAFQTTHHLLEAAADTKAFLDSVAAVNERLSAARLAYDAQGVRIENYHRIIAALPDEVLREAMEDNPLKRRISNTEVALMEARTKYGPDNPRVLGMEDELKEMRRTLASKTYDETRERVYEPNPTKRQFKDELLRLEAEKSVLEQTAKQVSAELAEVERKYAYLPRQQLELAGFLQRRAAANEMVQALTKSADSARLTADLDLSDFELLEPARMAAAVRSKLAMLFPILALLAGLFGGTALCVVLEFLDPKLRTSRQIELAYNAPCLGVVATTDPAALADAFLPVCRSVYQGWGLRPAPDGVHMLAVLSAQTHEGKSTLAFQIARYWAGLGVKTAYLDFDGVANTALQVPPALRGLEEYLADRADWESILFMQDKVACFKLLADIGDLPERLHGRAMARLVDTLRASYACVVIDTPAFLESRSAAILAMAAGSSLWLIDSSRTDRSTVNLVFDDLDRGGIRPMGIVLNFVAPARAARGKG